MSSPQTAWTREPASRPLSPDGNLANRPPPPLTNEYWAAKTSHATDYPESFSALPELEDDQIETYDFLPRKTPSDKEIEAERKLEAEVAAAPSEDRLRKLISSTTQAQDVEEYFLEEDNKAVILAEADRIKRLYPEEDVEAVISFENSFHGILDIDADEIYEIIENFESENCSKIYKAQQDQWKGLKAIIRSARQKRATKKKDSTGTEASDVNWFHEQSDADSRPIRYKRFKLPPPPPPPSMSRASSGMNVSNSPLNWPMPPPPPPPSTSLVVSDTVETCPPPSSYSGPLPAPLLRFKAHRCTVIIDSSTGLPPRSDWPTVSNKEYVEQDMTCAYRSTDFQEPFESGYKPRLERNWEWYVKDTDQSQYPGTLH